MEGSAAMKLRDLKKVYHGEIMLTVLAYFKNTKEYYSFRSYGGEPIKFESVGEEEMEMEVIRIDIDCKKDVMWVDVIEWI